MSMHNDIYLLILFRHQSACLSLGINVYVTYHYDLLVIWKPSFPNICFMHILYITILHHCQGGLFSMSAGFVLLIVNEFVIFYLLRAGVDFRRPRLVVGVMSLDVQEVGDDIILVSSLVLILESLIKSAVKFGIIHRNGRGRDGSGR